MPSNYIGVVDMKFDAVQMAQIRAEIKAAQHSMHLTALRRGLAGSLLFNIVLLAVLLVSIGGK